MAAPTILEKVKAKLRITHTKLDDDITDTIAASKKEMERAGIIPTAIVESDILILDAIEVYCLYKYAKDEQTKDGFFLSWQYQLDCLRKSKNYGYVVVM